MSNFDGVIFDAISPARDLLGEPSAKSYHAWQAHLTPAPSVANKEQPP